MCSRIYLPLHNSVVENNLLDKEISASKDVMCILEKHGMHRLNSLDIIYALYCLNSWLLMKP